MQAAWSAYRTPASKQFKMIRAYIITDGVPSRFVDMRVDYDTNAAGQPARRDRGAASARTGTWPTGTSPTGPARSAAQINWNGVAARGVVGAPRLTALIKNCTFAVTGWDVEYEAGSIL